MRKLDVTIQGRSAGLCRDLLDSLATCGRVGRSPASGCSELHSRGASRMGLPAQLSATPRPLSSSSRSRDGESNSSFATGKGACPAQPWRSPRFSPRRRRHRLRVETPASCRSSATGSRGGPRTSSADSQQVGWRLLDASGVELAQGTADADWKRVGGTAQCGGPREAMITLSL